MGPDAVAEMDPMDVASEEYIGTMQNVCDAVERWLKVQVSEIEMEPVEAAEMELRAAFDAYVALRDARAAV